MVEQTFQEQLTAAASIVMLVLMLAIVAGYANRAQFVFQPQQPLASDAIEYIDAEADPAGHAAQYRQLELDERFQQAVAMLHAKQYDYAITALHRVIELNPDMPEAYVNMGFALIGLERYAAARDFFSAALEINTYQANAYWGLGVAAEQLGDLEAALGAMRTYLHLSPPNDPYVRKARSALWEWDSQLKRGPLPAEEQEWIERRSREWEERNGPETDIPNRNETSFTFSATSPH